MIEFYLGLLMWDEILPLNQGVLFFLLLIYELGQRNLKQ